MDKPLDKDLTAFGTCVIDRYVHLASEKNGQIIGRRDADFAAAYLRQITLQVGGIERLIQTLAMTNPKTGKRIHPEQKALTDCEQEHRPLGPLEAAAVTPEFRQRQASALRAR